MTQEEKKLILGHAKQVCNSMLKDQIKKHTNRHYVGGFSSDGRTTPGATRLEGLLASLDFIPAVDIVDIKLRKKIELSVKNGIAFLINSQIKTGKFKGAIPRAVSKISRKKKNSKRFNRRSTEIRIDYVQHALSAMIEYQRLFSKH